MTVCTLQLWFCPWIFIQINNFFKMLAPEFEPLTLGSQIQRGTPENFVKSNWNQKLHQSSLFFASKISDDVTSTKALTNLEGLYVVWDAHQKKDIFFTAGSWEKGIIFGGHLIQILPFMFCQSFIMFGLENFQSGILIL